uniref:Transcription cofactor vestigial-like protein 4 n=1 Tax=Anopheles stephensi TaxID=30069 RepID=A0A182Y1X5_ANOST
MIRDPGGTSPNENQDSPPSPKYDRILGRPPPPDETEIPLDMTVRRKDSSDGQGSPTGIDPGRDVPINLNVRPSVITKAPPPPIKKRISHMHTNGEIVLKSSVRTTTATTVESTPIVNVSSTSSISSNSSISSSLSNTSGISSSSGSTNNIRPSGGGIRVVAPDTIELKLSSDPAPPVPLVPATVLPPSPGAPSSAASPPQQQQKRPDSGEEVDDHFAKALGDTWKKIQESNMNL